MVRDAYPDFVIAIDGRWEVHEVKPDAQFARPEILDRLCRTAHAAEKAGLPYSVSLANELFRRTDEDALDAAWRRVKRNVHPINLQAVSDALRKDPMTAGELLAALAEHRLAIEDVHAMLASGHLRADMTTPPDERMVVHSMHSDTWFDRLIPFNDPRNAQR